jgi:hypothetical protein
MIESFFRSPHKGLGQPPLASLLNEPAAAGIVFRERGVDFAK